MALQGFDTRRRNTEIFNQCRRCSVIRVCVDEDGEIIDQAGQQFDALGLSDRDEVDVAMCDICIVESAQDFSICDAERMLHAV